mmetsp:Transcript_36505/g.81278  ORF Transcript_36505/g.81278 Transcript_36505/m.81278 type:complete len:376 (-) Transcript_36505:477-1604(-)
MSNKGQPNSVLAAFIDSSHLDGREVAKAAQQQLQNKNNQGRSDYRSSEGSVPRTSAPGAVAQVSATQLPIPRISAGGAVTQASPPLPRTSSSKRRSSPSDAPGASRRHLAQDSVNVLFRHYLELVEERKPLAMDFEKPKGLAKLFVLLCPALDFVDLRATCKTVVGILTAVSRLAIPLSFILAPLWLWQVREVYRQGNLLGAATWFVAGLILWVCMDLLLQQHAAERSRMQGSFNAANANIAPHNRNTLSKVPSKAQAAGAGPAAAGAGSRGLQPGALGGAQPSGERTSADGGVKRAAASGPVKQVRQLVMKLEAELYGNELTEGVLPLDVLPLRVRKLCQDVGVTLPGNEAAPLGMEEMLTALQQVLREVGLLQ